MLLSRVHKILLGVLVAQCALIAIVQSRRDDTGAQKPEPVLPGFDAAKVDKLAIYGANAAKPSVELARRGAEWVVATSFDYPVARAKIDELLGALAKLQAAGPMATQASRHKQLHVDDAEFDRKLVVGVGDKTTTLYVGGAAGPRRVAVRVGGDTDVFAVAGVSPYTIGDTARQWVDASYLKIARDDIDKITIARAGKTFELARDGEHWKVAADGAALGPLDDAAVDRIVADATTIDLFAPADPKRDAKEPAATITIVEKAKSAAPIVIDVLADGDKYWVHDRAVPRAALVDKGRLDAIVDIAADKLVKKPEPPPGAGSATPPTPKTP
jgi:hypothetical protein